MVVHLVYDERMALHKPLDYPLPGDDCKDPSCRSEIDDLATFVFERPERLTSIYAHLARTFGEGSIVTMDCPMATREQILSVHSALYYESMKATANIDQPKDKNEEMYFNQFSFQAAKLACGGVIAACRNALVQNVPTLALVRPPGHHACQSHEMGFCMFNSVAVAAKCCGSKRTVILDWDIHHGNGTQELVWNCQDITYISMHRYGTKPQQFFFPGTGSPQETNDGANVNIAWTRGSMGNAEYAAAMSEIVLPLIVSIDPALLIVSCGLDAADNDLIGDCHLTPDFYGAMTKSLLHLNVPLVLALEGGYNIPVICQCMQEITTALLLHGGSDETDCSLLLARQSLSSYWNHEAQQVLARSAVRNIHETMDALEQTGREFGFRRINNVRPRPSKNAPMNNKNNQAPPTLTPTIATRTRGASKRNELSDLTQWMDSMVL